MTARLLVYNRANDNDQGYILDFEMNDIRRKRLLYRANYRGFKEADLLLGGFAKANIERFTEDDLSAFEHLLEAKDHDIYNWITGKTAVPAQYDTPLFTRLRLFKPEI